MPLNGPAKEERFMNLEKRIRAGVVLCVIAAATLGIPALAQEASVDKYVELLRSDLRTQKVQVLTEALDLPEAQAAAFWPIYREYENELAAIGDRRVSLIKRFAEGYGKMTSAEVDSFARDYFAVQKDRIKLREKYFKKVEKATSSVTAARFVQVENVIGTLVDLQINAEMPLFK